VKLEILPLIFGVLIGLLGIFLLFDAWTVDEIIVKRERRRRPRLERNRGGEAAIGIGVLCMAAAFIGRDTWSYSVLVVIVGTLFLVYGAVRNRSFLGAMISNRGALRRRPESEASTPPKPPATR
jgi:hypothetical protein